MGKRTKQQNNLIGTSIPMQTEAKDEKWDWGKNRIIE